MFAGPEAIGKLGYAKTFAVTAEHVWNLIKPVLKSAQSTGGNFIPYFLAITSLRINPDDRTPTRLTALIFEFESQGDQIDGLNRYWGLALRILHRYPNILDQP
jgi:hypothetical protein